MMGVLMGEEKGKKPVTATTVGRVSWLSKSWRLEAAETSLQEALLIGGEEKATGIRSAKVLRRTPY